MYEKKEKTTLIPFSLVCLPLYPLKFPPASSGWPEAWYFWNIRVGEQVARGVVTFVTVLEEGRSGAKETGWRYYWQVPMPDRQWQQHRQEMSQHYLLSIGNWCAFLIEYGHQCGQARLHCIQRLQHQH